MLPNGNIVNSAKNACAWCYELVLPFLLLLIRRLKNDFSGMMVGQIDHDEFRQYLARFGEGPMVQHRDKSGSIWRFSLPEIA